MSGVLRHLLVATDGSENAKRAVAFAVAVARRHRCTLLLCYVVDHARAIAECSSSTGVDLLLPLVQALDDAAKSILADAAKQATDAGLVVATTILDGRAAQAIVKCATGRQVDAIIMGTQGKRGFERFFLGSTAEGVLRRTDVPTFLIPAAARGTDPAFARIVVAVDDSGPSEAAAAFALTLAQTDGARLLFCGVAETDDVRAKAGTYGYDPAPMVDELCATVTTQLTAQTDRARSLAVACERVIAQGEPAAEILQTAERGHADLIVVGTHGRRGLRRLFVGSVAEGLACRSPIPIAVVRVARSGSRPDASVALATVSR